MAVVRKRKVWWIVGGVLGFIVLAGLLLMNWYGKHQESIAEESAHRVERALKQLDDDETAKDIRAQLVNEIGEFDSVEEVHWYASLAPNYAYIHGTVIKDGTRYHIEYFLKKGKIVFWGAGEENSGSATSSP